MIYNNHSFPKNVFVPRLLEIRIIGTHFENNP